MLNRIISFNWEKKQKKNLRQILYYLYNNESPQFWLLHTSLLHYTQINKEF